VNPLANLEDIQLPQAVSMWPLAPAYWVSIFLFALLLIVIAWIVYKRLKTRECRRFVRKVTQHINSLDDNDPNFLLNVQKALKIAANKKWAPAQSESSNYSTAITQFGEQWKTVLAKSEFIKKEPSALDILFSVHTGIYNPSKVPKDKVKIKEYAVSWIRSDWTAKEKVE